MFAFCDYEASEITSSQHMHAPFTKQGCRNRGWHMGLLPPPPANFFKVLFFVMKGALFVQANVAVNTILTSRCPCEEICFKKKVHCTLEFENLRKCIIVSMKSGMTGNFFSRRPHPTSRQHFGGKFFRCPFHYSKVLLEAGGPQSFDASNAPVTKTML